MVTIILKNNAIADVVLNDIGGLTVPFGGQVTASDLSLDDEIYESSDLVTAVTANDIIINNGTSDLSISEGLEYLTSYNIANNPTTSASQDDAIIFTIAFGGC